MVHRPVNFDGEREREREREMFYLTMHSTHFIYGYMASDRQKPDLSHCEMSIVKLNTNVAIGGGGRSVPLNDDMDLPLIIML